MRRALPLLAALLVAAVAAAPAAATVRRGPGGLAFYTPPKPIPGTRHGDLVWARPLAGPGELKGAHNELLLYRSQSVGGKAIAVSGTLSVPTGKAPKGGWPIVTYAHGTTGIADRCAPSRDGLADPAHLLDAYVHPLLERWLKAGFAVARTDYEGLGTPGVHPYLVGRSEGRGTLDIVRAARSFDSTLGKRVVIAGHSQGGHAALWAAGLAPTWTPELNIRETVAFAPASHIAEQTSLLTSVTTPGGGLSALSAEIFRGADTADPALHVASLLSPQAAALYPQTLTTCLPGLALPTSFGGLAPSAIVGPGANLAPTLATLERSDPENLTIHTPVRIEQGEADTTVFPQFTDQLAAAYSARHVPLVYKTYPGITHGSIVVAAATDATSTMRAAVRR
jgi:pimeloyl-ACP methyl ester carboxylesterase